MFWGRIELWGRGVVDNVGLVGVEVGCVFRLGDFILVVICELRFGDLRVFGEG